MEWLNLNTIDDNQGRKLFKRKQSPPAALFAALFEVPRWRSHFSKAFDVISADTTFPC
jgi:hypothetical protein